MIITFPKTQISGIKKQKILQGPQVYLELFFVKNTLLLEDSDLERIDYDKWKILIGQIKILVRDKNINTILIDATINPVMLNFKYWDMAPTYVEMLRDLSQITNSYILTGDFTYYYNTCPGILFFPIFLWILGTKNIHLYYDYKDTVYDTTIVKNQNIMCLNRNLTWHRLYFFSLIANKSWFDNLGYSFVNEIKDRLENPYGIKKFLTPSECDGIRSYEHLLPIRIATEKNNPYKFNMWHGGASSIHSVLYSNYALNVVTETSLTEGILLTEKTCKPFMAYQIPIIIGPIGTNKFLEDIGLDMFSDYIPWKTWDSETDHKLKIRKIVEFLDQLLSSPTAEQDILSTHQNFHPRLIKNKEYFHSKELENILLAQIKS